MTAVGGVGTGGYFLYDHFHQPEPIVADVVISTEVAEEPTEEVVAVEEVVTEETEAAEPETVTLVGSSIEKDLKIKIQDSSSKNVKGQPFEITIKADKKKAKSTTYSDDDKEVMIQERQSNIDECQAKYETAPEAINYTGSPSDNQIHSISELVSNNPSNEYYSWQSEFDGANASIFYGINDASNGSYQSLYLQNNENYGNLIRYRSSKLGYINVGSSVMSGGNYSDAVPEEYKFAMEEAHWVWPADEDMPIDKISEESGMAKEDFIENTKDVTTISEADARQKAEDLLQSLGMHDFTYYSGGLVTEVTEYNKIEALRQSLGGAPYRTVYAFRYQRCIDGVFVNNDGGSKIVDEWQGDTYNKKLWSTEDVVVFVDDDGIVGFDYLVPLEVTDTVVEKSTLKNFDEVKDIFEQMAITMNAVNSEEASDGNVTIDIDSVKLRYTRISEKDSFDTGLLVPVWDFIGTKTDQYGYEVQNAVIMSINAIDGSVIDRSLGY